MLFYFIHKCPDLLVMGKMKVNYMDVMLSKLRTKSLGPGRFGSYMTLTRVESAFRALKSELGFRPVYHHGSELAKIKKFFNGLSFRTIFFIYIYEGRKDIEVLYPISFLQTHPDFG